MNAAARIDLDAIRARHAAQPEVLQLCLGDRLYIETNDNADHAPPVATMYADDEQHTAIAHAWKMSRADVFALLDEIERLTARETGP